MRRGFVEGANNAMRKWLVSSLILGCALMAASGAALSGLVQPSPWQLALQEAGALLM